MSQNNLFSYNDYTGQYDPVSFQTRMEAHHKVNKDAAKEVIREFASRADKPFHAFEIQMITGLSLLSIRPRLTEMCQDGELKIIGKTKTQYSKTHICLYERN
jgi:hypothetical protein